MSRNATRRQARDEGKALRQEAAVLKTPRRRDRTALTKRSRIRGPCQGAGGEGEAEVAKVVCVLYDDPVDGYPTSYARDAIPRIERYYDGQTTPTPEGVDFEPGELLGSVSGELGLRRFLEERGHTFVVTSDKDGPDSLFERELP